MRDKVRKRERIEGGRGLERKGEGETDGERERRE